MDNESLTTLLDAVYGWKVKDGKAVPPSSDYLPECIKERIEYFKDDIRNGGLAIIGAINLILSEDEKECKELYELGAVKPWLPVSEEARQWLNVDGYYYNIKKLAITIAVTYDTVPDEVED